MSRGDRRVVRFAVVTAQPHFTEWEKQCIQQLERVGAEATMHIWNKSLLNRPIHAYRFDFILLLTNELEGDWGGAPLGVWSFTWGATPASIDTLGWWEVYRKEPTVHVSLWQDHQLVQDGQFRTIQHSIAQNRRRILQTVAAWPALYLQKRLVEHGLERRKSLEVFAKRVFETPTFFQKRLMDVKVGARKVKVFFDRMFRDEYWNVGIIERPIAHMIQAKDFHITWLARKKNSYYADPFGWIDGGHVNILLEEMRIAEPNGFISTCAYSIKEKKFVQSPERKLVRPHHLSYPYLFQYDGVHYCIPESAENEEVNLYRYEPQNMQWQQERTLLQGIPAVDSTVFQCDDRWWLFCTVARQGTEEHNDSLHLFYADDLHGEWREHPLNPVKVDVCSSRGAGTPFHSDGKWYRPAQDCSTTYGGQIVLNEIIELTPLFYEEVVVRAIEPDKASAYPDGYHTLSKVGEYTLIDGKRQFYHWATPFHKWRKRRLKRLRV
ncbi:hypothetical protein ACE1TF_11000 [Geomicrobium sp. JSM 1781026]|uniref:glucosamine inositolphosphorylceramide transferase family protein n=1 Tax=Geomicrobium sp. JSM 1781026 TaxID=3344580 RepID=UPI0035BFB38C